MHADKDGSLLNRKSETNVVLKIIAKTDTNRDSRSLFTVIDNYHIF